MIAHLPICQQNSDFGFQRQIWQVITHWQGRWSFIEPAGLHALVSGQLASPPLRSFSKHTAGVPLSRCINSSQSRMPTWTVLNQQSVKVHDYLGSCCIQVQRIKAILKFCHVISCLACWPSYCGQTQGTHLLLNKLFSKLTRGRTVLKLDLVVYIPPPSCRKCGSQGIADELYTWNPDISPFLPTRERRHQLWRALSDIGRARPGGRGRRFPLVRE